MNPDQLNTMSPMEQLLSGVDLDNPENLALNNRCVYLFTLYKELKRIKEETASYVQRFNKKYPEGNASRIKMLSNVMKPALNKDFQGLFQKLKLSDVLSEPNYPKRQVQGNNLEDITAIDISVLGINGVVSKDGASEKGFSVSVPLEDIDALRMDELTAVCALAGDNQDMRTIVKAYTLDMSTKPLFEKESAEVSVGV